MSWGGYVGIDLGTAGTELAKYTITYNANGTSVSGMPSNGTKTEGTAYTITTTGIIMFGGHRYVSYFL